MYKLNLKNIKVVDLLGNDYLPLLTKDNSIEKIVGNEVFIKAQTIDMNRIAQDIFDGKEVELSEAQKTIFESIIDEMVYLPFIKLAIKNCIQCL